MTAPARIAALEAEVARLRKSLKVEVEVETEGTTARAVLEHLRETGRG